MADCDVYTKVYTQLSPLWTTIPVVSPIFLMNAITIQSISTTRSNPGRSLNIYWSWRSGFMEDEGKYHVAAAVSRIP